MNCSVEGKAQGILHMRHIFYNQFILKEIGENLH